MLKKLLLMPKVKLPKISRLALIQEWRNIWGVTSVENIFLSFQHFWTSLQGPPGPQEEDDEEGDDICRQKNLLNAQNTDNQWEQSELLRFFFNFIWRGWWGYQTAKTSNNTTNWKKFMCDQFHTTTDHTKRPMKIHTMKNSYHCSLCAKKSISRSHIQSHALENLKTYALYGSKVISRNH